MGFGHIDSVYSEADKFPVLASFMILIFIVAGRDYLSRRAFLGFMTLISIFLLIAVGPNLLQTTAYTISNPVVHILYFLPGFGSMRVLFRSLLVMSSIGIVAGSVV